MDNASGVLYAGYGVNGGTGTVTAITISNDQISGQTNTTYPASALALTPDNTTLFAAGCGIINAQPYPCTAVAIATTNLQPGSIISLYGSPGNPTVSPNGNELWVSNNTPNQVTVVGSASNKALGGAEVSFAPYSLAVTPDGSKVYANCPISGEIVALDGQTFARRSVINVGNGFNLTGENAVSPDGTRAYMMLNDIQVVDTSTDQLVGTIADEPQALAVSNDSKTLFALEVGPTYPTYFINAYSTATLQKLYSGASENGLPNRLLISPVNNELFVLTDTSIDFVKPNPIKVVQTIKQGCVDGALAPDGSLLYCLGASSTTDMDVLVYDTSTGALTNTFSTNYLANSGSVAITPDGSSLFISVLGGVLEKMNTSTGAITVANTPLVGQLAIQ